MSDLRVRRMVEWDESLQHSENALNEKRRPTFEPADKHVQVYEFALCFAAQLLVLASRGTRARLIAGAAVIFIALSVGLSLWKLLLPSRFSATRCAYLLIGAFCVALLVHP